MKKILILILILLPYVINTPAVSCVIYTKGFKTVESYHIISENVKVTVYHAVVEQCDSDPFITADGSFIDTARAHKLRWCAVSRDLLAKRKLHMGDTIYISSPYSEINGVWRVRDKMGKYFWQKLSKKEAKFLTADRKNNPKEYKKLKDRIYHKVYQYNWIDLLSHPKHGLKGRWDCDIVVLKKTKKKIKVIIAKNIPNI